MDNSRSPILRTYPIVRAVAAQLLGGLSTVAAIEFLRATGQAAPVWVLCLIWGGIAAAVSIPFQLGRWWLPVQAAAPVVTWMLLGFDPPAWFFPIVFLGLLGAYWNAIGEGVPLYLSNRTTWRALESVLPAKQGLRMIDLGSGLGGTLIHLARARPDGNFHGVETAPLVFLLSRLRVLMSGCTNIAIEFKSIWRTDLAEYDLVYCFLSPVPMARLFAQAKREMRPGTIFISNSFEVPEIDPDEVIELDDSRRTRLLIWRM